MFGDFLFDEKHQELALSEISSLPNGSVVIAVFGNTRYQFAVYGKGRVILQQCHSENNTLYFSYECQAVGDFCKGAYSLYQYTPDFEYDGNEAFDFAYEAYKHLCNKHFGYPDYILSPYGDDFTTMCITGGFDAFLSAFRNSNIGKHCKHKFHIMGCAPAYHHVILIEQGWAVHFSFGDDLVTPQIIVETSDHINKRAQIKYNSELHFVSYDNDSLESCIGARNKALLVFAGYIDFGEYDLFLNNCEHFVTWCKTGKKRSGQIRKLLVDTAFVGISILIRRPQFAMIRIAQRFAFE